MKRVILMRHAKSSWESNANTDHERPLNARGERDAPFMDQLLASHGYRPDLILSSDSTRTRQTISLMPNLKGIELDFERRLYHASAETILHFIHEAPPQCETLMILAHNPGITNAVFKLSRVRIDNVPTSGIVIINLKVDDFTKFDAGNGVLEEFFYPKMKN